MSVIMGTAGHIDHGKTSLIRALTGIDCDRLGEEKRRGITIELGFAYADLPGGERMGIVDMPGHERFVRTMVAGASGIDFVLLVISADEGVMPYRPASIWKYARCSACATASTGPHQDRHGGRGVRGNSPWRTSATFSRAPFWKRRALSSPSLP